MSRMFARRSNNGAVRAVVCLILAAVLTSIVTLSLLFVPVPGASRIEVASASSSLMEDCDLDGYDDHTGAPVPWPGFDGTRGDTVPSGWDGVSNSWTGARTNDGSTSGSASTGSRSSGNGSGSHSSGSKSSSSKSNPTKATSGSTAASGASGTKSTTSVTAPATSAATRVQTTSAAAVVAAQPAPAATTDTATIVSSAGTLVVADTEGAALHLDGTLRITGTGFAPLVGDLGIAVDTNSRTLTDISTDEKGAFETEIELPSRLAPGMHEILVTYKGTVITRKTVTMGPATANTFLSALLVGFTDSNPDRGVGLVTLLGLVSAGSLAWGSRLAFGRSPKRRRRPLRGRANETA